MGLTTSPLATPLELTENVAHIQISMSRHCLWGTETFWRCVPVAWKVRPLTEKKNNNYYNNNINILL